MSIKTGISYFGNRSPRHFVSDLEEIIGHHCSFIVHTFSENDLQFYAGTMKELVSLSKDAGLQCYLDPWGVGRVFGGEAYSSFALRNPDSIQLLPDGAPAPAACLNHPRFRGYMRNWIESAAYIGADVLFWDEPHFFIDLKERAKYDLWYCSCTACQDAFRRRFRKPMDGAALEDIKAFRDESVVEFLTELCDQTHGKGMQNAVCMLPFQDAEIGVADWGKIAGIPAVDIFGTDPYWIFFDRDLKKFVGGFAADVQRVAKEHSKEGQIWIQAYKIPAGREEELKEAVAISYAEGIRNIAAWSYYGTEYMSYIRSDNPQKVWDVLGDVYGELQAGKWE